VKVIIITKHNGELIRDVVEKAGHAVVAQTDDLAHLLTLLVQYAPHCCFVEHPVHPEGILEKVTSLFPRTRFVPLTYQRGSSWTQTILDSLGQGPIQLRWDPSEPEQRTIITDLRYFALGGDPKHKRPTCQDTGRDKVEVDRLRLLAMMRTARRVGTRAEAYRDAVAMLDGAETREMVYRTLQGNYRSMVVARDQIARYLGYLCHYVPGADLDCLVPAVPQPANARFLHYDPPAELLYASYCLSLFGFNVDLAPAVVETIRWRYEGGGTADLTRTALAASGLVFVLKAIVMSHCVAISWLTDPDTPMNLGRRLPRAVRRTLQTFRDFWDLSHEVMNLEDPKTIVPLLIEFHSHPEQETLPDSLRVPSFAEFHQATNPNTTN